MLRLTGFLRARLGRRIALLFVVCAIVPIGLFSALTLVNVRDQLTSQSYERLHLLARETGQSLLARLHTAALEASRREFGRDGVAVDLPPFLTDAVHVPDPARPGDARLEGHPLPALVKPEDGEHLRSGSPLLHVTGGRVLMAVPGPASPGVTWISLDEDYVRGWRTAWNPARVASPLPAGVELCVIADSHLVGECPPELLEARAAPRARREVVDGEDPRAFRWSSDGGHLAWMRPVFLGHAFGSPEWELVLSEREAVALAPARAFERMFLLAATLSLLVVPFLSQVQIRRNLEPLAKLERGTRRIAERDFESRVDIRSGDEFEQLASSFNAMAARLGRQFGALSTASELDRAILGELDERAILDTVLRRGPEALSGARVAIVSCGEEGPLLLEHEGEQRRARPDDWAPTWPVSVVRGTEGIARAPAELASLLGGDGGWSIVPVRLEDRIPAALLVGMDPDALDAEDGEHALQLADRLAVALSNARLVDELDRLNLQTITAFARAIDAKSAWTAGHSERVTAMALRLSAELGLDEDERETLERGALLHDIGKIGVPGAVLDKAGPLTDDEFRLMRAHTTMGASILEPISRLEDIAPIVRHHHERWDGAGYPDGLAGKEIPLLARVTAVADVFDALGSARPYRDALPVARVVAMILADAGTAFDPDVAAVLPRVVGVGGDGTRRRGVA